MTRAFAALALGLCLFASPARSQGVFMQQDAWGGGLGFQQGPGFGFQQGWGHQGWHGTPGVPWGWHWTPPVVPNPGGSLNGVPLAPDWGANGGCPPGTRPGVTWGGGGWQGDGNCHVPQTWGVRPMPHQWHGDGGQFHAPQPHGGGSFPAQRRPWAP